MSNTFTKIGLIAESTLKLINKTRSKTFENAIFEMKVVTYSGLNFKPLQFTTVVDVFFNLVLVCKDIKPRYGRTRTKDFF